VTPRPIATDERLRIVAGLLHDALEVIEGHGVVVAPQTPQDAAQTLVTPTALRVQFVLDGQHRAILAALNGRALTKESLAEATGISAGAINRKLAPLRERGMIVNQRGVGYFRPDAPPVS
jgi:biotin operon repressor